MEWIQRLNKAVSYIEEHIADDIKLEDLAEITYCSSYHFQRMFGYMADVSLAEYIRRRRMTLAALDLQSGNEKIVDIALKYGYQSPTAFNRTFHSVHGIAPSAVKKRGTPLKSYPVISFKITVKGREEMNYRIEKKEAFRIVGISRPLHKEIEENFKVVPEMWQTAAMDGTVAKLASMMNSQPMGLLGVSAANSSQEEWRYYIAVSSTLPLDDTLEEYIVPEALWAIFSGSGTNISIQQLQERIVTEWIPNSGYEFADAPDIEVYLNADPANATYEVWCPIRKAAK